jgi:hypothetical protein
MQDPMIHLTSTDVTRSDITNTNLPGHVRSRIPRLRTMLLTLGVAAGFAITSANHASAQSVTAKADVNGRMVVNFNNNAAVGGATGSAIAAAKIFHPAAMQAGSSYQVNGAAANAQTEAPILDTIASLARPIAQNAGNPVMQAANINGTRDRITTCTMPDTTGGPGRPCRVVAGTGSFPLVNKANGISSDTGVVQRTVNNNNYEFATATASQTMVNGTFRIVDNPVVQVDRRSGLPAPEAVAYTANRDPMAVYWNSSSNRSFTLDLSQMQVNVSTTGPGAAASAYYAINASVIDGTTDITLPESASTPIFSLLLPFNDVDGMAPTINLAAFQLGAAGAISDSLGDVGLINVANGLLSDLTLVNGTIQFAQPYALNIGLPGMSSQSVLFIDTQGLAEAVAAPEPSSLLLLGSGLLGLGGVLRKRFACAS